ncbi:Uncharacterised protein [Burkholderia cenocepacia]|nr:Uncharacterised protein [Burkholderia cenocepacia]
MRHHVARRLEHLAQQRQRVAVPLDAFDARLERVEPRGRHAQVRELRGQRVGARQHRTGQPDVQFEFGRHARQEMRGADVGHEADARFRHRDLAALGRDAQRRALREAHAAAHRHAVHQRDDRLRERVDRVIEPVLVDEERQPGLALRDHPVQLADVTARAEALLARAAQHERDDLVVVAAALEQRGQLADHRVRQRVERGRPVQRDQRHAVHHAEQHLGRMFRERVVIRHRRAHRCGSPSVRHCGARLPRNAATPSRGSAVSNRSTKRSRSTASAAPRGTPRRARPISSLL